MNKIAVAINFCTHDVRFLKSCVQAAKKISDTVVISVCDHFFDGTPENYSLLQHLYREYSDCVFVEFAYDPNALYDPYITTERFRERHWHNTGRAVAFQQIHAADYILFLDVDEIIDPSFSFWLKTSDFENYDAMRFASYYYFREARYRAKEYPEAAVLIKKSALDPSLIFHPNERRGLFDQMPGNKKGAILDADGNPMFHHYSWVRTKEELLRKVASWGHRNEENWANLIEEEFSRPFNGSDFTLGYTYEEVEPFIDPLSEPAIIRMDAATYFKNDLIHRYVL